MSLIILSSKVETVGTMKYNNALIESFFIKIGIEGFFGIQNHISIIYPRNQNTSSIDIDPKKIERRYLGYKSLFQNHFAFI